MYKLNKILWATDGSKSSIDALDYSKIISSKFNSETTGIYVISDLNKKIFNLINMKLNFDEMISGEKDAYEKFFSKISNDFKKRKKKFSYHVACGKADEEILHYAGKNKADLIVLGHKGSSSDKGICSGSCTNKIIRYSDRPVLIVNAKPKTRLTKLKKIVVPVNLTEDIYSALDYAVFLAAQYNAQISVLYVQEFISYTYEMPIFILDDLREYFNKKIKKLTGKYAKHNLRITADITEFVNPYVGIVRHCERVKPDLIVMNTHQRKGLKQYFIGSITEKIINNMPCPVLTLKP